MWRIVRSRIWRIVRKEGVYEGRGRRRQCEWAGGRTRIWGRRGAEGTEVGNGGDAKRLVYLARYMLTCLLVYGFDSMVKEGKEQGIDR